MTNSHIDFKIDFKGTKLWYKKGKLHKEGGPAVEFANGDKEWYKNGKYHITDGPAREWADGGKEWWIDGGKQNG